MTIGQIGLFWAVAGGTALAAFLFLWAAMRRAGMGPGTNPDVALYRDQLAEVDRDERRGIVDPEEAKRIRAEVSRRLLAADRDADGTAMRRGGTRGLLVVMALILGAGSLTVYGWLGAPGYPDMPMAERIAMAEEMRANRPGQAEAEAQQPPPAAASADPEFLALLDRLRAAVATNPGSLEGQAYLADYALRAGFPAEAARAQAAVVGLKGAEATAEDHARLADLLIRAAGGYVSPEAEAALTRALTADPANGAARYYSGVMLAQTGRPDLAFGLWRALLEDSAPGDPWVPLIRERIEGLAALAGVTYTLPPAAPGPDAADVAAAAAMTEAERQAMVEGMVEGLAGRLAAEGGPATDWARLITALATLGQTDRARAILDEARSVFAAVPADLETIRAAGAAAGLGE